MGYRKQYRNKKMKKRPILMSFSTIYNTCSAEILAPWPNLTNTAPPAQTTLVVSCERGKERLIGGWRDWERWGLLFSS
jgi:hypothetical protein